MKKLLLIILLCNTCSPVLADQATADAIDNMNTGMWARELIGNGEGFTGFCNLSKTAAKKIFSKKPSKKLEIQKVSNGNIIVDGKEYVPADKLLNETESKTYKAPIGYIPVGDNLLLTNPNTITRTSSSSDH